ncbi:unnamed protein product [Nezara viridula]|uniref:Uncharacterized protein n=1 Tax=Nezara viridula TaxID=85310 RepID=A0A9P0DWT5_NEZVI|nr:unnamed protein product [Nezara viridula]
MDRWCRGGVSVSHRSRRGILTLTLPALFIAESRPQSLLIVLQHAHLILWTCLFVSVNANLVPSLLLVSNMDAVYSIP